MVSATSKCSNRPRARHASADDTSFQSIHGRQRQGRRGSGALLGLCRRRRGSSGIRARARRATRHRPGPYGECGHLGAASCLSHRDRRGARRRDHHHADYMHRNQHADRPERRTDLWADVDPVTGSIDPDGIEPLITPRTRAIVMVHWGGNPCDIGRILEIARPRGIKVVEDDCARIWIYLCRTDHRPAFRFRRILLSGDQTRHHRRWRLPCLQGSRELRAWQVASLVRHRSHSARADRPSMRARHLRSGLQVPHEQCRRRHRTRELEVPCRDRGASSRKRALLRCSFSKRRIHHGRTGKSERQLRCLALHDPHCKPGRIDAQTTGDRHRRIEGARPQRYALGIQQLQALSAKRGIIRSDPPLYSSRLVGVAVRSRASGRSGNQVFPVEDPHGTFSAGSTILRALSFGWA